MKKTKFLLAALLIAFAFVSCDTSENNSSDTNFSENFGAAVSRDFIGQVVDADNHPIQGVTIKIGTTSVQTDVNGVFIINGASVNEKFAYITAKKSGYIDGSRAMVPTSGKNNVRIMLIQDTPLQTIQSGVTSEVSIYSGTKVVFDGAFQDENGVAYSGDVQVSMFHLTPSDENIDKLMPGMLYAQTQDNEEAVLETFGMLNVELRGSAGQKLNIASGHTAEITIRIDDSQIAIAPSSIPLWHFDEGKGYWKEDGTATKVGNKYVGNVTHFSWWNCDIPNSSLYLTFTFVDSNGNPLSNLALSIINPSGFYAHGTTDVNGQVAGFFPSNQVLTIKFYSINTCGTDITAGPFSSSQVLPNIVILNSTTILNTTIVGRLLKCDNTNVTNGYVLLNQNNQVFLSPVSNGNFSFNQFYCPNITNFSLLGFDFDNFQQTGLIQFDFKTPTTYVGNLMTCNTINEFVSLQVDEQPAVFYTTNLGANFELFYPTSNPYGISFRDVNNSFAIWIRYQQPGFYHNAIFTATSSQSGNINASVNAIGFDFNIAKSGQIGEYIDMTFDGTYYDGNNTIHRLRGNVHVIRDN